MKHKLFIHIGMPKTGTSSIQKFMASNNDILKKYGWNYPDAEDHFDNEGMRESDRYKNAGFVPYIKANILQEEKGQEAFDLFDKKVRESLKKYDTVLSDEGIWIDNGLEYLEYISRKYQDMHLIVYLRRQDFEMESWYNENVRGNRRYSEDFSEWYKQQMLLEREGALFYKYYDKLMEFEKFVTRKNIVVRSYKEDKNFDLYKDFLGTIGIGERYNEFRGITHINQSSSLLDIEVKRILNETLQNQPADIEETLQKEYWGTYEAIAGLPSFRFNVEERKELLGKYDSQNKKVSRHFCGGETLFDTECDFKPVKLQPNEAMLQYIGTLEKMLVRVCYRNRYPSLSFAFNLGKGIAVFGAGSRARLMIESQGFPAEIIIDNNEKFAGQMLGRIKIVSPKDISNWKKYFVIIAVEKSLEIEKQLENFGLKKDIDFTHMNNIL